MAHEAGLALFLLPARRSRFRESLTNRRLREKLQQRFAHFEDHLDERFARLHQPHTTRDGHVEEVLALLVRAGAPVDCLIVSDTDFDGQRVSLREGVEDLMLMGAGFISCVPGRLGLYVSEDGSNVFVLSRDAEPERARGCARQRLIARSLGCVVACRWWLGSLRFTRWPSRGSPRLSDTESLPHTSSKPAVLSALWHLSSRSRCSRHASFGSTPSRCVTVERTQHGKAFDDLLNGSLGRWARHTRS